MNRGVGNPHCMDMTLVTRIAHMAPRLYFGRYGCECESGFVFIAELSMPQMSD